MEGRSCLSTFEFFIGGSKLDVAEGHEALGSMPKDGV